MESFRSDLDPVGLCIFLKDNGISGSVTETLEGESDECLEVCFNWKGGSDNEIDGESFMELTESEMKLESWVLQRSC